MRAIHTMRYRLSAIIIGRFMLDLRYIHTPGDAPTGRTGSHVLTTIVFYSSTILGNIGSIQQTNPSWASGGGDDDQLEEEEVIFSRDPLEMIALSSEPRHDDDLELQ